MNFGDRFWRRQPKFPTSTALRSNVNACSKHQSVMLTASDSEADRLHRALFWLATVTKKGVPARGSSLLHRLRCRPRTR